MMKKKTLMLIGGLLATLMVIGAVGASIVYAQGSTPPANGPLG